MNRTLVKSTDAVMVDTEINSIRRAHARTHALTHARARAHTHTHTHTHTLTHTHMFRPFLDLSRKIIVHFLFLRLVSPPILEEGLSELIPQ